jgi:hypothetical protein
MKKNQGKQKKFIYVLKNLKMKGENGNYISFIGIVGPQPNLQTI